MILVCEFQMFLKYKKKKYNNKYIKCKLVENFNIKTKNLTPLCNEFELIPLV